MSELSPALRRALGLLTRPPTLPSAARGYLDLLGDRPSDSPGTVQSIWLSGPGSALYDHAQAAGRRLVTAARAPSGAFDLRAGQVVVDVGCGPGSTTPELARALGPDGLALGVDVSVPMLTRAASDHQAANLGYLRADATDLPFRGGTVDAVVSLALLQLVDDPAAVLAECARVLRPGGRATLMVPHWPWPAGRDLAERAGRALGLRVFDAMELPKSLRAQGFRDIRVHTAGPMQWIIAEAPSPPARS